ncbi:MAG: flagellar basal body P-ring protein FlgI [Pirellulales bacterium]|nr:flagellar basal body P-ring protein FlgI [Pirellulales bacterium]
MRFLQLWLCLCVLLSGCSSWNPWSKRSQSPDDTPVGGSKVKLVGDQAGPYGMFPVKVEAIGLVVGLPGTGCDPAPSPERAVLLAEMQRRGVEHPSKLLASNNTALVKVRGYLRAGIQKGDHFDVEIRVPSRSETTSLRGGWLMETRLKQMTIRDDKIFDGHTLGIAEGAILVDPGKAGSEGKVLEGRGRILSGGRSLRTRSLGLALKNKYQNVSNAARIARAINKRFFISRGGGIQKGVAAAKTEKYVDLQVHPRYKDNVGRYISVVRSVAIHESEAQRRERLTLLERQLCDPITSAHAALQLEAIGRLGIDTLKEGIASKDPEVRFRAAESLAYLDVDCAAEILGQMAQEQPAFRVFALTALSAMEGYAPHEQLTNLLSVRSAETRYGAFRALWSMNPLDAMVRGESLGGQFSYHVIDNNGPPMIHVTRNRRPEIVLFGKDQELKAPLSLEAGPNIMVNSVGDQQIAISRFNVGMADQKRIVSMQVGEVIRAVVELGGTYPDVVQLLQNAKAKKALPSRFEIDALPQAGRRYDRMAEEEAASEEESGIAGPYDEMAAIGGVESPRDLGSTETDSDFIAENSQNNDDNGADSAKKRQPIKAFFAKMTGSQ